MACTGMPSMSSSTLLPLILRFFFLRSPVFVRQFLSRLFCSSPLCVSLNLALLPAESTSSQYNRQFVDWAGVVTAPSGLRCVRLTPTQQRGTTMQVRRYTCALALAVLIGGPAWDQGTTAKVEDQELTQPIPVCAGADPDSEHISLGSGDCCRPGDQGEGTRGNAQISCMSRHVFLIQVTDG